MTERQFRITLYAGAKQPIPVDEQDFTWAELVASLRDLVGRVSDASPKAAPKIQKEHLFAWAPHRLAKPYRLAANVEAVTCMVIDVDQCELAPIIAAIETLGIAALIYESPSDPNPDGSRRIRVAAPITREIVGLEDCDRSRLLFAQLLRLTPGNGVEGALGLERLFFAGQLHDTEPRDLIEFEGHPLDVDALLAEPLDQAWTLPKDRGAALATVPAVPLGADEIGEAIGDHESFRGRRHDLSGAVAGELRKLGVSRSRAESLGRAWLRDKWAEHGEWFMGAWTVPASEVTGRDALEQIVGDVAAASLMTRFAKSYSTAIEPEQPDELATDEPPAAGGFPVVGLDTDRKGDARPTITNAELILTATIDGKIRYDEHRRRVVVAGVDHRIMSLPDGPWRDHYTTEVRAFFESFGLRMRSSDVLEAIERHAQRHKFNPVEAYAYQCAQQWDGTPRVDHAMTRYWRTSDPHAALVSRIWFLSLARRMVDPGCKVHTVLVLTSDDQYLGKSSSLEALVPVLEWYSDSPLPIGDKDGMQNLVGKVVWEIGEAASTNKRDADALKQFFASRQDTYRGSFNRFAEDVARTPVFAITANNLHGILRDATGERRYMPVSITEEIDVEGIRRDRDQLIGEAVVRAAVWDEPWHLTRDEVASLAPAHDMISEHDALEDVIAAWIDARHPIDRVAWADLASFNGPLKKQVDELDQNEQRRVRTIMRRLGWRVVDYFDDKRGVRTRAWARS